MTTFATTNRLWSVATPLPSDTLVLVGFRGSEGLSQLFRFQLDLVAQNSKDVPFDKLLGQKVVVSLALSNNKKRYFSGICSRLTQAGRDTSFTAYRMEVVPQLWLLTRRAQSRIFQHATVPDILKEVLAGLDVDPQIHGKFPERDYCVQYRETDLNFASRLMEEEGIYYFFKHTDGGHKLVLANTPPGHPDLPEQAKATFQEMAGGVLDDRVTVWEKAQELRSGKFTLWDHCFELPHKHLEADATIPESVKAGKVAHKLKVGGNDKLELYDYPGEYAQRFDGVDKAGGDRPADVKKIFEENKRTVGIRMEEEAAPGLVVSGAGNCRTFVSGHKFTLERHFNGDGQYVLVSVEHSGRVPEGNGDRDLAYQNSFTCIPAGAVFRPSRRTPKPFVQGTQTAVVVGLKGDEICTDKYGRIKVQFHWDRKGKHDAGSSCWVRVATPWAGKHWGMIHIPRVGQEVVVAFEEGDPDRPIVIGSVYNADMMPPYALPANKTQSGVQSRSSLGGTAANCNEIKFEDKKGSELVSIHAEKDQSISVEHDESHTVGHDRTKTIDHDETTHVKHDRTETVDNNEKITIGVNRTEKVGSNEKIDVGANRTETVGANESIAVTGNRTRTVGGNESVTVTVMRTHMVGVNEAITVGGAQEVTVGGMRAVTVAGLQTVSVGVSESVTIGTDLTEGVGGSHTENVTKDLSVTVGKNISLVAGEQISITTGKASIVMKKDGTIMIQGKDITINATGEIAAEAKKDMTLKGKNILQN
ncbi:MAG TPA: type VI secretion system tip protein TssI/VgrG [Gemmataceae bacterium]|nr:type VI secretion system tip protein TssI/VgrG [Gemmataceae bacterium]